MFGVSSTLFLFGNQMEKCFIYTGQSGDSNCSHIKTKPKLKFWFSSITSTILYNTTFEVVHLSGTAWENEGIHDRE